MSGKTHLTKDNRKTIEAMLNRGHSASAIARKLNVSKSTITREIENHTTVSVRRSCECIHYVECSLRAICERCPYQKGNRSLCKYCKKAQTVCPRFEYRDCAEKSKVHVCNHCPDKGRCQRSRALYDADSAQEAYEKKLSDSRSGFSCDEEELEMLSLLLKEKLGNGQSLYAIKINHPEIRMSESTLRRIINKAKFNGLGNINLPRAVKFKRRKGYDYRHKKEVIEAKKGHTIEDFNRYMEEHPGTNYVEMDTVVSKKGTTAALLTLLFVETTLQIAHFMRNNTPENVIEYFDGIEMALGTDKFRELFPVIVTDNGTEFDQFKEIERSIYGGQRTRVFFCHPYRSNEKPHCENNHALIRRILRKGTDFTKITQKEVDLMMNHINAYVRKKYDGAQPITLALQSMEVYEINYFHLEYIDPDDAVCAPKLLKQFYDRTGQTPLTLGELSGLTE